MVGSDQADQRAPGAKSVMMGGGLASLEGGRMEVPRQATVPKPMSASVSHPLEQRLIKKGRELKIGKLGGVWKSKRPDTF